MSSISREIPPDQVKKTIFVGGGLKRASAFVKWRIFVFLTLLAFWLLLLRLYGFSLRVNIVVVHEKPTAEVKGAFPAFTAL